MTRSPRQRLDGMQRRWFLPTVIATAANLVAVVARVGACGIHDGPCSGYASSEWAKQALGVAVWLGPFLGALAASAWLAAIRAPARAYAALPLVALPLVAVTVYAAAGWSPRPSDASVVLEGGFAMLVVAWALLTTLGGAAAGRLLTWIMRRIRRAIRGTRGDAAA